MGYLKRFLQTANDRDLEQTSTIAFLAALDHLGEKCPPVAQGILGELKKQRNSLKLIASENYSSLTTQLAMANLLTDKYAEGHPFHRFYAGCENVDSIESLGVEAAKKLFGAEHAYLQPHSGADANLVAFWSVLVKRFEIPEIEKMGQKSVTALSDEQYESIRKKFGQQKILGMSLDCGGHLTHGSRVNLSSKMFHALSYGVDPKTLLIDYKAIEALAMKEKPLILIVGYSAYSRLIDFSIMKEIAHKCGAVLMVDMAHFAGLVAGKVFKGNNNPIPFADIVTSTTHKTLRGPRGGLVLCKKEFEEVVNKGCPHVLGGPLPHVMAAKLVALQEAMQPDYQTWAHQVVENAKTLCHALKAKGVEVVSGATDNHLLVIDVKKSFGLSGRQAEKVLAECGITVNRNMVPFDKNGAWYTSGVRIGTPALTTRGMTEKEMAKIAEIIYNALKETKVADDPKTGEKSLANSVTSEQVIHKTQKEVGELLQSFPLYPEICIDQEMVKERR